MGPSSLNAFWKEFQEDLENKKKNQLPSKSLPLRDPDHDWPCQVSLIHGLGRWLSRVRNCQLLEPWCPFEKNPHLGHLCSLRCTTAHKYGQILFAARWLWESRFSLPPKVNRLLSDVPAVAETLVLLPSFFLGGLSARVQSHPSQRQPLPPPRRGRVSLGVHGGGPSHIVVGCGGGVTLCSSLSPAAPGPPEPTIHTTPSLQVPTPQHVAFCPQAHRPPNAPSQLWGVVLGLSLPGLQKDLGRKL